MNHRSAFSIARHRVGNLRDRISGRVTPCHFDFNRIIEVGAAEFADIGTKRRRKQQCLPRRWQQAKNALEVG